MLIAARTLCVCVGGARQQLELEAIPVPQETPMNLIRVGDPASAGPAPPVSRRTRAWALRRVAGRVHSASVLLRTRAGSSGRESDDFGRPAWARRRGASADVSP